jgi:hypothetical protein
MGKFAQRAGWRTGRHTQVGGEFVSQFVPKAWRKRLYPVPALEALEPTTLSVSEVDRIQHCSLVG